jgi:hypothetical protein
VWWQKLLRAVVALCIVAAAFYIANTMRAPPEIPDGVLSTAFLIGAFALAWLADEVLRRPRRKDP